MFLVLLVKVIIRINLQVSFNYFFFCHIIYISVSFFICLYMGSVIQEVALRNVRFFSPIGYYEEERILGNEFFVDVLVYFPFRNPNAEDLTNTINYEELYQLLCKVMEKERKLLESAAEELLSDIQTRYNFLNEVRISIRKTTPPFGRDEVKTVVSLHYKA